MVSSMGIYAQNIGEVIDTPAPSQETWEQIQQTSKGPSLRYGPGEIGDANKETLTPLGAVDASIVCILFISAAAYAIFKNRRHKLNKQNI